LLHPVRDNVAARATLEALRQPVQELIEEYEKEAGRDGGAFGRKLLEILEGRVTQQLNGRAELSDRVSIVSCSCHVVPGQVFVDARLRVEWEL